MPGEKSKGVATADLELATAQELSKIVGVSKATIHRYVERKILTSQSMSKKTTANGGVLFNISDALAEIKSKIDARNHHAGKHRHANSEDQKPGPQKRKVADGPAGSDNLSRYNSAKAEDMELKVKLNRQKLDEQNRRLMDVERVKKTIYSYNSRVREAILNIPDQLGPELYASKSLFQMQERLRKGLNQALSNLENLDNRIDKITEQK